MFPLLMSTLLRSFSTVEDFLLVTSWIIKAVLRIQKYLQHEHYALWEVIEFGNSYKAPPEETAKDKGLAGEVSASTKKKGRTMAITAEDMQKRKNDVKARTTLLLALPDEHQLRFSKYDSAKELWETILKTFGGNEATKKSKKNQLKQQYGNFKAEEVWRNRDDLDTMSLDDVYNNLKVYEPEVILLESADHQGVKTEGRERESYKKDPKEEEHAPKAMIVIDGIVWDWSYMAEEDEALKNHAVVAN
nr:hypothetical protein [Tanacetum cinerariifolium]